MTWHDTDGENIRVISGGETSELAYIDQKADRTPAQKHMDLALVNAAESAQASLEALSEALEWFVVVKPDYRSTLPIEVGQLIEAIAETKRLRG